MKGELLLATWPCKLPPKNPKRGFLFRHRSANFPPKIPRGVFYSDTDYALGKFLKLVFRKKAKETKRQHLWRSRILWWEFLTWFPMCEQNLCDLLRKSIFLSRLFILTYRWGTILQRTCPSLLLWPLVKTSQVILSPLNFHRIAAIWTNAETVTSFPYKNSVSFSSALNWGADSYKSMRKKYLFI